MDENSKMHKPCVLESFIRSKSGCELGGDDRIILGKWWYGVIDGATDRSGNNWGSKEYPMTGGSALANIVAEALTSGVAPNELVDYVNNNLNHWADSVDIDLSISTNRPAAAFAAYYPGTNTVYSLGDCGYGLVQNDQFDFYREELAVDELTYGIRQHVNDWLISRGVNPYANGRDLGREFIQPMIAIQSDVQNMINDSGYWVPGIPKACAAYKVFNGNPVEMTTREVPDATSEIVFASDGFARVERTLSETRTIYEAMLRDDPHCMGPLLSSKGLVPGNVSHDDQTYLRIKL